MKANSTNQSREVTPLNPAGEQDHPPLDCTPIHASAIQLKAETVIMHTPFIMATQ